MALCRCLRNRPALRQLTSSISTGSLDKTLKKSQYLRDSFLQPIEQPALLQEFPDFTVLGSASEEMRPSSQRDAFAVVQLASHQFKVTPDDKIYIERIRSLHVNAHIHLNKVLVWASHDETVVGRPFISNAYVEALVEEQCEDARLIVFKKKRRKGYRRAKYHTQQLTGVRILRICEMEEILKRSPLEKDTASDTQ